jgi:hypothetical protein
VKDFSSLALPLTKLTKKTVPSAWTFECLNSFKLLKTSLANDITLPYPDPDKQFSLSTDASDFKMGEVLSQKDSSGYLRPAFLLN